LKNALEKSSIKRLLLAVISPVILAGCGSSQYDHYPAATPESCIWVSNRPDIDLVTVLGYRYPSIRLFHFEARNVVEHKLPDCTRRMTAEIRWSEINYPQGSDWTKHEVHMSDASIISITPPLDIKRPCGPAPESPQISANIIRSSIQDPTNTWEVRNASAPVEIADDPDYCLYRITADVRSKPIFDSSGQSWSPWRTHEFFLNHSDVMKAEPLIPYLETGL